MPLRKVDVNRGASFLGGCAAVIAVVLFVVATRPSHSAGDFIGLGFALRVLLVLIGVVAAVCAVAVFLVWRMAIGRFDAGATEVGVWDLFDPRGQPRWASRGCWSLGIANIALGLQMALFSLLPDASGTTRSIAIVLSSVGTLYCLAASGMEKRKSWASRLAMAVAVVLALACGATCVWGLIAKREEMGTWSVITVASLCAVPHVVVGITVFRNRALLAAA